MHTTLAQDLKQVLIRRLDGAPASEILAVMANLASAEILPALSALPLDAAERYVADDDTVSDRLTGLTWSRGNVPGGRMNWKQSVEACAALDLAGCVWRSPMPWELLTIVDYDRLNPAINPIFRCEPGGYWTAKPYAPSPGGYAWFVRFSNGSSGYYVQDDVFFARAVCSSQS